MAGNRRWDPCIAHRADKAKAFISDYFQDASRRVLLVAGAGFDPRSTIVAQRLVAAGAQVRALFLKENRPDPGADLVALATTNADHLAAGIADHVVLPVEIFGVDGAVVGGRNVVTALSRQAYDGVTDVVVDTSALSVGTSFPIIRYLLERIEQRGTPSNLHVFVAHDPTVDRAITSTPSDSPGYVHGFKGGSTLHGSAAAAKLWLPQLATGRRGALARLHQFIGPHDTCPILPFPASNPRLGDMLAEEYLDEFESGWSVDARDIVYADEDDPLDLYRTILRLHDLRRPVFEQVGGSMLVLSPLGSKVMALGALMAALERDLPVAYIEAMGYSLAAPRLQSGGAPNLVHIWLEGDAYPQPRPALQRQGASVP